MLKDQTPQASVGNKMFNAIARMFNTEPIYTCDRRILENVSCICVIHTRTV